MSVLFNINNLDVKKKIVFLKELTFKKFSFIR